MIRLQVNSREGITAMFTNRIAGTTPAIHRVLGVKAIRAARAVVVLAAAAAITTALTGPASAQNTAPEPAEPGTGMAAYFHPNGVQANVFYVGANGQIYNWYWTGTAWTNSRL
jgi:hypothetical protein